MNVSELTPVLNGLQSNLNKLKMQLNDLEFEIEKLKNFVFKEWEEKQKTLLEVKEEKVE